MPARVQTRTTNIAPATSYTLAYTSNNTAGNALFALVSSYTSSGSTSTTAAVSDSRGNGGWARQGSVITHPGINRALELWACFNCAGGANTLTFTFGASAYSACAIAEYSDLDVLNQLEISTVADDAGAQTSHATPNAGIGSGGNLVLGGYADFATSVAVSAADGKLEIVNNTPDATSRGQIVLTEAFADGTSQVSASFTSASGVTSAYGVWVFRAAAPKIPARIVFGG